ncbi:hypothetical protein AMTRI_Chr01g113050 [Amborella trichopoda]|uniref:uncharacterized protein LOC110007322 isoform X2 n=1 Tax=Amborella trichopoda TaxID=13333 RepID=UPI0009BF52E1|nr:uncharacterized protein LOC110007322 isoform X2 [Amborella trichopoda]|eukprot:XP_020523273.1 uncharacterized protein LOC110007322 isoform X2 [Amborella trichopoda]
MLDDMGIDEVPLRVVLDEIKEQRRTRVVCKKAPSIGKAPTAVSPAKSSSAAKKKKYAKAGTCYFARLEARSILKKGLATALPFGDPIVVDLCSSSSSSTSRDDDLNEAVLLEELYFDAGPDGPGGN